MFLHLPHPETDQAKGGSRGKEVLGHPSRKTYPMRRKGEKEAKVEFEQELKSIKITSTGSQARTLLVSQKIGGE